MDNRLKTLVVHHIADREEDCCRIAFSPQHIKFVASNDVRKQERDLKNITITFMDGDIQGFCVSGLDLMTLEEVVAGYDFD
jgi:hypothetical protein